MTVAQMNRRTFLKTLTLGLAGGAIAKAVSLGDKGDVLAKVAHVPTKTINDPRTTISAVGMRTEYTYKIPDPEIGTIVRLNGLTYYWDGKIYKHILSHPMYFPHE